MKITQKIAAFYVLLKAYRENPDRWVDVGKFTGEIYIEELGTWFFMIYKCPANGVAIFFENPDLIERQMTKGKMTGSEFYQYRIVRNPSVDKIKDPKLLAFYKAIKK